MQELIQLVAAGLERAVNATLALDPEARDKLRSLEGRALAIELSGLDTTVTVLAVDGRLTIAPAWDGTVDATLAAAPFTLLRLGLTGDTALVRRGHVTILGDVPVAQAYQDFFQQLDIDWEEHVARLLGDGPAHRLGSTLQGIGGWLRERLDSGLGIGGEYLQEEARALPSAPEVAVWREDVATLRDDVARLEARLRLLEQCAGGGR